MTDCEGSCDDDLRVTDRYSGAFWCVTDCYNWAHSAYIQGIVYGLNFVPAG